MNEEPLEDIAAPETRSGASVSTPWGDIDSLRDRMLRPGERLPREEVAKNQRERLFAAMVAICTEKGYEATRVADLLEVSGVSRKAFYEHFSDKRTCLIGAVDALITPAIALSVSAEAAKGGEERAREVFEAFINLVVHQAAAARLCFVEVFAAGPEAAAEMDRMTDAFQEVGVARLAEMPGREGMPVEIIRAVLGGLRKIIHTRLYRRQEEELIELIPQMWEWAMSYLPPPTPLRRPHERARAAPPGAAAYDPAERILRALAAVVAEKGYSNMTVSDVADRASISLSTFYAHFNDKEEAMLAAVDSGSAQMLAATLPAFRRAKDWPQAVHGAFATMFAFAAAEPEYTTLGAIDVYAAGTKALEQRDRVMQGMEGLLVPGYERSPETSPVAAEAIGGAIYSMINDQLTNRGAKRMQEIGPLATYITLTPFLGAEEACAVANSDSRSR